VDPVETQYVERDGSLLAYQVIGSGPAEILLHLEANGHLDLIWTDPHCHALYERVGPSCQLVVMQRRGFGLSDPISGCPTVEQQAEDVLAVLDAAGFRDATLAGAFSACAAIALAAATSPDRVRSLLLIQPFACGAPADMAVDRGWPVESIGPVAEAGRSAIRQWGAGRTLDLWDANIASTFNRRLMGLMERCSATPAAAVAHFEFLFGLDFADVFRAVGVPTRVLYVPGNFTPEPVVRRVAELIDGAEFVPLPVPKPGTSLGEAWIPIFDHMIEVGSGRPHPGDADRILGTVLFTDLVKSTELLNRIGDARYRDLRADHERQVRLAVEQHQGRLVNVIGDGTVSVFDRAADAVRCAEAICRDAAQQAVAVRSGVHTGELERTGMDVTGMTVHVGARIAALAGAGEVLVSRTVKDLLMGADLHFRPRGTRTLKGVPGRWDVYALAGATPRGTSDGPKERTMSPGDRVALRLAQRTPRLARGAVAVGNAWQRRRAAHTSLR
jgi:class 3 adenylate cyclase/pimeloyl-ACP methyl ester carboxylesterase